MKNDTHIIARELQSLSNELSLSKKEEQELKELKKVIHTKVKQQVENYYVNSNEIGGSLFLLYKERFNIIGGTTDYIVNAKTFQKSTMGEIIEKPLYNFNKELIKELIEEEFEKAFKRLEKEEKQHKRLLQEELFKKAREYIINLINNINNATYKARFIVLEEMKEDIIADITEDYEEQEILRENYTSIINKIKREYKVYLDTEKQESKQDKTKLALPWKILLYGKAIKKIWKS